MTDPIQTPSPAICDLCDHCDLLIETYLESLKTARSKLHRYESDVEFYTLLILMMRHIESLTVLARNDMVLAPSANLIARTIFGTGVKARWMYIPIDPYEREVRWLLFFRSGITHARKLAKNDHTPSEIATEYENRRDAYADFDTNFSKLLADMKYTVPKQPPNIAQMLKELEEPQFYNFYVLLSAYTHSNFEAASLYKKGLGNAKKIGEFTSASDWMIPFNIAWQSFYLCAHELLNLVGADIPKFEQLADADGFQNKLQKL